MSFLNLSYISHSSASIPTFSFRIRARVLTVVYKAMGNLASQDLSLHHLPLPLFTPFQSHGCLTFPLNSYQEQSCLRMSVLAVSGPGLPLLPLPAPPCFPEFTALLHSCFYSVTSLDRSCLITFSKVNPLSPQHQQCLFVLYSSLAQPRPDHEDSFKFEDGPK